MTEIVKMTKVKTMKDNSASNKFNNKIDINGKIIY